VRALVDGTLLSPQLRKTRLDSARPTDLADPQAPGYGLALGKFGPYYGHTGELPGYNAVALYDPATKNSIVVWASLAPSPDGAHPPSR
jgi:D-alanyl-D-alanine carboxypeptidase